MLDSLKVLRVYIRDCTPTKNILLAAHVKSAGSILLPTDIVSEDNNHNQSETVTYVTGRTPYIEVVVNNIPRGFDSVEFVTYLKDGSFINTIDTVTVVVVDTGQSDVILELTARCAKQCCTHFSVLSLVRGKSGWYLRN